MPTIEQKMARAQEKKERNIKVCQDFRDLQTQYPQESRCCLCETLAARYRIANKRLKRKHYPTTGVGIYLLLRRTTDIYNPNQN